MKILAIETSSATFSLALAEDGLLISEMYRHSGLNHSERLVPLLERLLADADWTPSMLDKVAVSTGPGSFTGIRVGLTCARVLAQGLGKPLVGMTSLDLLAAGVPSGDYRIVPIIDALREEVFMKGTQGKAEIKAVSSLKQELQKSKRNVLLVGNAVIKYRRELDKLSKTVFCAPETLNYPRAGVLALAAQAKKGAAYEAVRPLYIRRSWAEERAR